MTQLCPRAVAALFACTLLLCGCGANADSPSVRLAGMVMAEQLDEISGMGLYGPLGMSFTCGGGHYDIRLSPGKCLRKYNTTYNYLREKAHTGKDTVRC